MHLTALIPAHNDAYTLRFCLESIAAHFDHILVLDDASTDETPDVALDMALRHKNIHWWRNPGPLMGWVQARNQLLTLACDSPLLFWLDADDVLCEYNAHLLRRIAEGDALVVRLQLCEMWGDFNHTTQRLCHYDRCHVFVNRRAMRDFCWRGGSAARPETVVKAECSPGPLFFHLKGVKPDERIVERSLMRQWLRGKLTRPPAEIVAEMPPDDIHQRAIKTLLTSQQDRLKPTYLSAIAQGAPRRPEVIENALPGRFQMVYKNGQPFDRAEWP